MKKFQKLYDMIKKQLIMEEYQLNNIFPQYFYHATYKPLLDSIIKNGLGNTTITYWEDSKPGVVYLADDPNIAKSYAETNENLENEDWLEKIIIFKININNLDKTKLFIDKNVLLDEGEQPHTYEYYKIIPFEHLELI